MKLKNLPKKILQILLHAYKNNNMKEVSTIIHAIGNAGPLVIPPMLIPFELFSNKEVSVRLALVNAMRKYTQDQTVVDALRRIMIKDENYFVKSAAKKLLESSDIIFDSNFPFNKSYVANYTLGGDEVSIEFQGELFAGTNFDCNEPYFNYEALALAEATANFMGESKTAFLGKAIYGKENGQVVGNEIFLQIWDDVIYDEQIPLMDCNEHTYELYSFAEGISEEYVLWISVIPVIFTAEAGIALDFKWGWSICDDKLSALVELIPTATLEVDGSAEIDLLIIKAGVALSGSFNTQIRPQGFIYGSECTVGFDILQDNTPMGISFTDYYAVDQCEYWIFDCNWGKEDVNVIFDYNVPANSEIIYDQQWKIAS